MRGVLAVVLVSLFALAETGCGGGDVKSKNAYVDAVNTAQSDFVSVVDDAETKLTNNADDAQTARQLVAIQAAATKVVASLQAVKPPGNVRSLHTSLVREAQGLVASFSRAADAYKSGQPAKILTAKATLSSDVKRVNAQLNATIRALNEKLHG
jgi:hypothetical protein